MEYTTFVGHYVKYIGGLEWIFQRLEATCLNQKLVECVLRLLHLQWVIQLGSGAYTESRICAKL